MAASFWVLSKMVDFSNECASEHEVVLRGIRTVELSLP
jgi:hypothetical protein